MLHRKEIEDLAQEVNENVFVLKQILQKLRLFIESDESDWCKQCTVRLAHGIRETLPQLARLEKDLSEFEYYKDLAIDKARRDLF